MSDQKPNTLAKNWLLFLLVSVATITFVVSFVVLPNSPFPQTSPISAVSFMGEHRVDPIKAIPHNFTLDGCNLLYLDMGTNLGAQLQKFYEPHRFLRKGKETPIVSQFNKAFGGSKIRRRPFKESKICVVGFEPNPEHTAHLENLQSKYREVGWNVWVLTETALGVRDTLMKLYIWGQEGIKEGSSLSNLDSISNENHTTADIAVIDTIKFLKEYVAKRETDFDEDTFVLAKMDIESTEFSLLREMTTTGAFCYIDKVMAEFHERMVPKGTGDINQVPMSEKEYENLIRFLWKGVQNDCKRNFAFDRMTKMDDETFVNFMDPVKSPDMSV